jgi:hypothetical protein
MFTLIRLSPEPASPIRIVVSQPEGDDAGLTLGGTFYFQPPDSEAGKAGEDRASMSEYAARQILADPVYGSQFRCEPPLPSASDAPVAEVRPAGRRRPEPPAEPAV